MKELIKLELRKLVKQKSLYICLAIMLVLILMSAIVYKVLMASAMDLGDLVTDMNNIDGIFFTLTTLSSADFLIIMGIVIAITFCYDFEEQTIKNIISRGYNRKSIYFSKVISILCATAFTFIVCFAFSFALGAIFFGLGDGNLLSMLGLIGLQFLVCLAYSMFFTFICAICKKMAIAITMNIVAPLVLTLVVTIADSAIRSETFKVADYWLDGMITNATTLSISTTSIIIALVGAVVYASIFITCGVLINKKTEV